MKIEDIKYEIPKEPIDEEDFDIEKWRKKYPMDYFKAIYLINNAEDRDEAFNEIYGITRFHIPDTLFKYYSLTDDDKLNLEKMKTLEQKQIFMSDVKHLNDPFDNKAYFYNSEALKKYERLKKCGGKLIDDFSSFNKVTSLTSNNVNSMPMWAHYANNHKGFCVSYDMKSNIRLSGNTFPVQYTDERIDITYFMDKQAEKIMNEMNIRMAKGEKQILINDLSLIYLQLFFCNIKHISWSYEKEFRCSVGAKAEGMPYISAVPKEIYIGMNCLNKYKKELKKIAKQLNIPIYQMQFDDLSENFNLISKRIEL